MVAITLFDFTDPENPLPPLRTALEYVGNPDPLEFGPKKITISAGDDVACGTVSLPLNMLSQLMAQLMEGDRQRSGGLILPPKPNIILPN